MSANATTVAPPGRKKILQGKHGGRVQAPALSHDHDSQNTSSPEGAKENETGEKLLDQILENRRRSWRGKGKYIEPAPPKIADLQKLPPHWTWATIEQLTSVVATGATPYRGRSEYWEGGTIPWITSGALNDVAIDAAKQFVTPLALEETNAKLFPRGTLLVALYGEGKTRGMVSELRIDAATNQACAALLFEGLNCELRPYIRLYLQKNYDDIRRLSSGGVQPNLSLSIVKHTAVPLPPVLEQRRIVAEIEKQFTRLDAGVGALRRVQANLKRYRAAVLEAVCEGRLVPTEAELARKEGRSYETGAQLLQRILAERWKNWNGRSQYKEPVTPNVANLPNLPEGWCWAGTEQVTAGIENAITIGPFGSNLMVKDYRNTGVSLIFVREIRSENFRRDDSRYVSKEKAAELATHKVRGGDVVITKMGEPPGDTAIYPEDLPDAVATSDCIKLTPNLNATTPAFLKYIIRAQPVKNQIQRVTRGVAQKKMSLARFKTIAVPLPPLSEQIRIVGEVERRFSILEEVEAILSANLVRAARLRQSILQRAFAGEMT